MENVFNTISNEAGQCTYQSVGAGVPELNVGRVEPHGDVPAVGSPADAGDGTGVLVDGHKLRCGSARGVPQVHRVTQSDGQHVVASPVEKVEVVVINKVWSVQSPLSRLQHKWFKSRISNHNSSANTFVASI
jgi:hypothetical protein